MVGFVLSLSGELEGLVIDLSFQRQSNKRKGENNEPDDIYDYFKV